MKKKEAPIHQLSFSSMIAWGCLCGGRWLNEHLKNKTDEELIIECDSAFQYHVREMEKAGY